MMATLKLIYSRSSFQSAGRSCYLYLMQASVVTIKCWKNIISRYLVASLLKVIKCSNFAATAPLQRLCFESFQTIYIFTDNFTTDSSVWFVPWKGIRGDNISSLYVMLAVQLCLFEGLIWEVKPLGYFSRSVRIFTHEEFSWTPWSYSIPVNIFRL